MSVRLMASVFLARRGSLRATQRLVLLRLADFASDDGSNVYPTVARIALDCGLSERAVQACLRSLEAQDLLRIDKGADAGRKKATTYKINVGAMAAIERPQKKWGADKTGERAAPVNNQGCTSFAGRVHVVRGTGERAAPNPLIEPSSNPSEGGRFASPPERGSAPAPKLLGEIIKESGLQEANGGLEREKNARSRVYQRLKEKTPSPIRQGALYKRLVAEEMSGALTDELALAMVAEAGL